MRASTTSTTLSWARRLTAVVTAVAAVGVGQAIAAGSASATPSVCGNISGNLVHNCGFETPLGPSNWTLTLGAGGNAGEGVSGDGPNSGTGYLSFCSTSGNVDQISQPIAGTVAQHLYEVRFSYANTNASGAGEGFTAGVSNAFGGASVPIQSDGSSTAFPYGSYTNTFRAGSGTPVLTFSGKNLFGCWDLDDISVTDLTTTLSACDMVAVNLVTDCGFEAASVGDLTPAGWTMTPAADGTDEAVDKSGVAPNSGLHAFSFGALHGDGTLGKDDTISQSIDGTVAGEKYDVSFWLQGTPLFPGDEGGLGPDFTATMSNTDSGTVTIVSGHQTSSFSYTEFDATFVALASEPVLTFSGANPDSFFDLDDIVVTPDATCEQVADNLIQNCGFETGDLTDWDLTQATDGGSAAFIDSGPSSPHSGNHHFALGATGTEDDSVAQTFNTDAGAIYSVSLWVADTDGSNEPDLFVTVSPAAGGDASVIDAPNGYPAIFDWTEFDGTFTGTGSPATITIAGRHPAGWFGIDDVVVRKTASGPPPVPYVPPSPTISVASSKNPATPGDSLTFTATLLPAPASGCGSVSWLVDNAPTSATASGSGGTYTLGPVTGLAAGTHPVTAVFSGCSTASGANGTVIESVLAAGASPSPSPSPTGSSGPVTTPTITARVSSDQPKHDGWYTRPVTITFTCGAGSSPVSSPCPDPVTLSTSGKGRSVTRTVTDTDGGMASVTVTVDIDSGAPTLTVHPRAGKCTPHDPVSGGASCVVHKHTATRHGVTTVHWTATAMDVAGNTATETGHYAS